MARGMRVKTKDALTAALSKIKELEKRVEELEKYSHEQTIAPNSIKLSEWIEYNINVPQEGIVSYC